MKPKRVKLTGWENGEVAMIWEFNVENNKDGKFPQTIQNIFNCALRCDKFEVETIRE